MGRLEFEGANGLTRLDLREQMGRLDFEGANGSTRLVFWKQMGRLNLREQMGPLDSILGSKWVDSI